MAAIGRERQSLLGRAAEGEHAEPVRPPRGQMAERECDASATSALRRSAVPKVIDGPTSRSSHVASPRSGTWTRPCVCIAWR